MNSNISSFFATDETEKMTFINNLSICKERIRKKGGEDHLVMFLSGMGGTGKSEVIKAFTDFAEKTSNIFGWNFDTNVTKITALTGTEACEIPNGRTLHSITCLNTKITKEHKDMWESTKMLIIDEVSFLDTNTIETLDENMRILKNSNELYGGV